MYPFRRRRRRVSRSNNDNQYCISPSLPVYFRPSSVNIDLETTVAFPDPRAPIIKRGAIERVIPVGSAGVRFFNREDAI